MKRLLIALTIAAIALAGCKGDEKKDEAKAPEKTVEKKKAEPEAEEPEAEEPEAEEPEAEEPKAEEPKAEEPKAEEPKTEEPKTEEPKAEEPEAEEPKVEKASEPETPPTAEEPKATEGDKPVVVLETNLGLIKIELTPSNTPVTVENFLQYVNDGFFAGTIFHRVVPGFVIQGGGFTEDFTKKETRDPIENEAAKGIKNVRGTISMARTRARNSATSQFFISLSDNPMLDYRGEHPTGYGYAAFGQVIEGMEVVDAIAAIPTVRKGPFPKPEVPSSTVLIEKAYLQQ